MVDAVAVRPGERRLPVIGFLVLVVVWLAIIKIVGQVTSDRADVVDGRLLETDQLVWAFIVPLGAAFVVRLRRHHRARLVAARVPRHRSRSARGCG